jgi:hypothetical protein
MPVKTVRLPNGRTFRFGRKRPVARHPMLSFKNYMARGLSAPPATTDYTQAAAVALANIYENDTLGDCVIAAIEHTEGVLTGNANPPPLLYTDDQTTAFYSAACGYVPGDANTDNGCDIQQTLAYWENNGSPAGSTHKIVGYLSVDPTNVNEFQTALWLFENLVFGVELPDAWISPFPSASGFVWDVAGPSDPQNGHCFPGFGYTAQGVTIATWGMTGLLTNAGVAQYAASGAGGELYVVISQDQLNTASQLAPNGFDWDQLVADFQALGGNVTPPPQAGRESAVREKRRS